MRYVEIFFRGIWALVRVVVALAAGVLPPGIARAAQWRAASWQQAADRLGLRLDGAFNRQAPVVLGACAGREFRIEASLVDQDGNGIAPTWTRFRLQADFVPRTLALGAEGVLTRVSTALGGEDLQTGDPVFDAAVRVGGKEVDALALLGPEGRAGVADLVLARTLPGGWGRVADGAILIDLPAEVSDPAEIEQALRVLVRVAGTFAAAGGELPAALARNARGEVLPAARRRQLEVLIRKFPEAPETLEACRWAAGLADDWETVSRAARHLGPEGVPQVLRLVRAEGAPEALRRAGLDQLIERMPEAELVPFLLGLLDDAGKPLWAGAARALGRVRHLAAVDRLLALAERVAPGDATTAEALAEALGRLGDGRAEAALIRWLEDGAAGVRRAAAESLGKVGTARAVEPLLVAERRAGLLEAAERLALRGAIGAIQARLGPAEPGRLSLAAAAADGAAGALSVAGGEAGAGALSAVPEVRSGGAAGDEGAGEDAERRRRATADGNRAKT
ncbi:MAG: HEAT repeat domain-containing protein [Planctomycetes bacterium]|nr:HEAT repeat domain-containing protein [Planctomycetota bacterium]